jgi:hypothetical protein
MSEKCGEKCEVYSRCCGYFRPVTNWNKGKQEEFKDREKFKVPVKGALALLLVAVLCLVSGCSALENKAFALGSGVDAFKLETSGGVSTGTVLPNLILGGAVNTLATAPAVADGVKTQVVFVRSRRNSFFGELFGIDAVTESVSYIGSPGETAEETSERMKAFASLDKKE